MEALSSEVLAAALPLSRGSDRKRLAPLLSAAMRRYGITENVYRTRAFLAQAGYESGQLKCTAENLNYTAEALLAVFPRYFDRATAREYAHQPERIANRVYADRLGNGDEASGDGWKYRGRGLIQITGRANYRDASGKMLALPADVNFESVPGLMETDLWACESAAWWWSAHGLNALADRLATEDEKGIMQAITRRINGGQNGFNDRWKLYCNARRAVK